MNQEKYQPSEEEMKLAEENLTEKQKIQSEAHEEGYTLRDAHLEGVEVIKKDLTFSIKKSLANDNIWGLINAECKINDVEVKGGIIPGTTGTTYRVYLEGKEDDVNKTRENIINTLKIHVQKNTAHDMFGSMFEGPALIIH
jgi:hypothetical protein